MADALISSTIKVTLERALSLASDRIGVLFGFEKDLASMTRSLPLINAFLADAEERQQNQDQAVQEWLKSLEEVAYDAHNVLDELHYESLRHQVESQNRHKLKVCCFFSFSNMNLAFRWRMASKVRDVKHKLNEINQAAYGLGLVSRLVMPAALPSAVGETGSRQTDSVVAPMIGRADDEAKIVKMLLSPSEKVVSVLPITGIGGLGKTTLAKSIYNNQQIDGQFEKRVWVCVSKKVPIVELFKFILVQLTEGKVDVDDRNVIVENIRKQLGGRRFFLVLDDVWDDNQALWEDFFTTLKGLNPANGSWCLVTTRLDQVADIVLNVLRMDSERYSLGKLPDDQCWSILKEKVVAGEEVPDELNSIRERAIKRCDGLPLAASVIGGLFRLKRKEEWQSILENRLFRLDGVTKILKLSFDNLPSPAIKKCFAYCSIFPKDTKMERDMLIELWMAEGFLQVDLENKTPMEKIGESYLEILLQSSLLEENWGRFYKMHDMVHDLAESTSKSIKVINSETGLGGNSNQVRYLAIDSFGEGIVNLLESVSTSLHTLFLRTNVSDDMLMKLKNLYVLNLSGALIEELPIQIGKLIHLQYIDFSYSKIKTLPESICKLYNLQTLRLRYQSLRGLPKGMSNLISLRHLHYYDNDENFQMPLEMGRLTCLQTLEFFNVGREKGRQIGELGSLKNLKGQLTINNLHLVKDKEGAEEANLSEKASLFGLRLEWAHGRREGGFHDLDVLEGLRPHPNLEELAIGQFMGDQFPRWLMDLPTTLPKLARLVFLNSGRCREFPPLPNFRSLKELGIWSCHGLVDLPGDMLHSCASLQMLQVTGCDNLISFPLDLQQTPSLLDLVLWKCPKVKTSLMPRGFGFLTCLRVLRIGPFSDDDDDHENSSTYNEFDWSGLVSSSSSTLRELQLQGLPHMESSLPHQLQYFTALTSLQLEDLGGVEALPGDMLHSCASLQVLWVTGCDNLISFPLDLQQTPSLLELELQGCPKLKTSLTPRGFGFLTCLRELRIGPFSDDVDDHENSSTYNEFDWSGLVSSSSSTLRELELHGLPHMESLPHLLQYLTTLTSLELDDFGGVEALPDWFGNFGALRRLSLWNFKKLGRLPSEDAMRRLTKLRRLYIFYSPLLVERCTPQSSGPDSQWSKVSHIPHVDIRGSLSHS